MTVAALTLLCFSSVQAGTRVTYKSAKSTSSYYQMAVQIAEAMKSGTNGNIIVTVEESQGSVQNVKEVANRDANYVFTTPPALVKLAKAGKKMFKNASPKYQDIRSLFVIPSLTMHFVARKDAGVHQFSRLDGAQPEPAGGNIGRDQQRHRQGTDRQPDHGRQSGRCGAKLADETRWQFQTTRNRRGRICL